MAATSALDRQRSAQQRAKEQREWDGILRDWTERVRRCVRCGDVYYEAENVGRWRCMQHVASIAANKSDTSQTYQLPYGSDPGATVATWKCCGKPVHGKLSWDSADGCVPCDHSTKSVPWSRLEDTALPKGIVAEKLSPSPDAILDASQSLAHINIRDAKERQRYVVVRRFDWIEAHRILYGPK